MDQSTDDSYYNDDDSSSGGSGGNGDDSESSGKQSSTLELRKRGGVYINHPPYLVQLGGAGRPWKKVHSRLVELLLGMNSPFLLGCFS
jgi:hypothetical protein